MSKIYQKLGSVLTTVNVSDKQVQKDWYALYTRPQWEKKVVKLLEREGIENYCPLSRTVSQWSDRKKVIFRPLISSYVFIKVESKVLSDIKRIDGVLNVVHWLGRPAVIKEKEIEIVRQFLKEHEWVEAVRLDMNVNDHVKVLSGPLMEQQGCVVSITKKRVKIVLPSLGYSLTAEVSKDNLVVFPSDKIS